MADLLPIDDGMRPMFGQSVSRDSEPAGTRSVAAFDRTVQIASDEFSVIKQLSYESRILESAEHGLQALTDS